MYTAAVPELSAVPHELAVGLISVEQLTLGHHFSGFKGITEVYNVDIAGNPDDHKSIPRTD